MGSSRGYERHHVIRHRHTPRYTLHKNLPGTFRQDGGPGAAYLFIFFILFLILRTLISPSLGKFNFSLCLFIHTHTGPKHTHAETGPIHMHQCMERCQSEGAAT
mgnify:CR=1 FL=1